MKHVKMLCLGALAVMALVAFVGAGTASATEIYSSGSTYSGSIKATLKGGTARLTSTSGTLLDTCTGGEVAGKIEKQGAAETASGKITSLTWTGCTEPTKTLVNGELEIHHITGTTNGTVTGKNSVVEVNTTIFEIPCEYTVGSALDLGNMVGSTTSNATLNINVVVPAKNSFFCPDARWEAEYAVTNPTNLYVEAS